MGSRFTLTEEKQVDKMIRILDYKRDQKKVEELLARRLPVDEPIFQQVTKIINAVRADGDRALLELTEKFDGKKFNHPGEMKIPVQILQQAWENLSLTLQDVLKFAADRIYNFHKRQLPANWCIADEPGILLTQRFLPLETVGVYVPGGQAAYPSSVLMNVIPAQIAGVKRIVMVTPPLRDESSNIILAAAHLLGITEIYQVGGAQAIAALAFGTDTIPRVDKVVGPGNIYVAIAKKLLYGIIDIDMIAGPSEIMIVADASAEISFVVADLLSQAEHDPDAVSILIYIGELDRINFIEELENQINSAQRREIINKSLASNGLVIKVPDIESAIKLVNLKAPEHLELMVQRPQEMLEKIQNASAIFVGNYTAEAIGDYVAGPNHTLPTAGTARFFSPLSVLDFIKSNHIVELSQEGFLKLADAAEKLAEAEQLYAHANAIKIRKTKVFYK